MSLYDYKILDGKGNELDLANYKGKVVVVVNTATGCGFTPHYEPLEKMYEDYHDKGLEIIDIPCNQFGAQTPGTDEEIHEFCTLNYKTQFPQMKKSEVNGPNELPLYTWLKSQKGFEGFSGQAAAFMDKHLASIDPDYKNNPDIKWNFTKFLINRDGEVVKRYEPTADLSELEAGIKELL